MKAEIVMACSRYGSGEERNECAIFLEQLGRNMPQERTRYR
jgi:hypothetical protein